MIRKEPHILKKLKRRDRSYGIAVDEDGEYRNIRRMPHGRHVVNGYLKPESNFGTEISRYAVIYRICTVHAKQADIIPSFSAYVFTFFSPHLAVHITERCVFYVRNSRFYRQGTGGGIFAGRS